MHVSFKLLKIKEVYQKEGLEAGLSLLRNEIETLNTYITIQAHVRKHHPDFVLHLDSILLDEIITPNEWRAAHCFKGGKSTQETARLLSKSHTMIGLHAAKLRELKVLEAEVKKE
ncbi:hypothetical protein [uncultured Microscilla sp.]|uniref:hypothetical protein n=1 Tax=uncultured Microscilla sp. TaxID=432653 RepID=UPI002609D361|nr:hypothetical protein [uncultured Microscilla sp.]